MDDKTYTLREASRELNIPTYVLRRICDRGLIRGIRRKRNGYRILNSDQVEQLYVLANLYQIGFSFADLKRITSLMRKGDATIPERKSILETKKHQLWQQVRNVQDGIDFIEKQMELLDERLR